MRVQDVKGYFQIGGVRVGFWMTPRRTVNLDRRLLGELCLAGRISAFHNSPPLGGADWKVLIGLWGLWTLGGLAALIGAGLWGMIAMIRTHDKNVSFPGIAAFAVSLLLTFVVEVSIMLDIGVIFSGKIAPFFI